MATKRDKPGTGPGEKPDPLKNKTQGFSTHPPPHRKTISGSFRLDPAEGEREEATAWLIERFSKMENFDTEITKKTIGGVLLREFSVYEKLPYCIRDRIRQTVLGRLRERTITYSDEEEGSIRRQLPTKVQIQQSIIYEVLAGTGNAIERLKEEITILLDPAHADEQEAERILVRMEQWLERYDVQLFAHNRQINISAIVTDLRSTLIRAKTKKTNGDH